MHNTPLGPVVPTDRAISALRPLPASAVRLDPTGLLGAWQERNRTATLPHCVERLHEHGNLANLHRVTGEFDGPFTGWWFADTDVHKTLEAALWAGNVASSEAAPTAGNLSSFVAETVQVLEKVQDPDGYLVSYFQAGHRDRQWRELPSSHEMYTAGHLIQAAVAGARTAPGDPAVQQLLAIARRFADLLVERFGAGGEDAIDGHPEIETALVELFRVTGHRPYLDLAARFVALRGHGLLGPEGRFGQRAYYQDHRPVRAASEVTGHVVRQVYLLAGAVDVAVETGDSELLRATERLWESAQATKTYLTGGQGSRHRDEAFGDPYELPPDRAYAETCAAIGSFQWTWRLLLATGRSRYADELERLLYNGIASGIGLDGRSFFYSNPLQLRTGHDGSDEDAPGERLPWYKCACCPPNLARLMASLHTYAATGTSSGLQLHLYGRGSFASAGRAVDVATGYPWDETVTITVTASDDDPWTLTLRVPAWCADARVSVNGVPGSFVEDGWVRLERVWRPGDRVELVLPMPPRLITPHPRVDAVRGTAALARGPLVYCLEHADLPAAALEHARTTGADPSGQDFEHTRTTGADVSGGDFEHARTTTTGLPGHDFEHARTTAAETAGGDFEHAPDVAFEDIRLDPGVPIGVRRDHPLAPVALVVNEDLPAVPYFLWANRGPGPMRVWIPLVPTTPPR
ncbi:glycoside hydrolase family 127 protein [Dactylosporangium sp. CS-047395]|uniref:glycoside hydrolase family 127 protein n=1 Tax=Dactylosporangium sp. CS-047395 TaxID=3239936 RepID=UPI003D89F377